MVSGVLRSVITICDLWAYKPKAGHPHPVNKVKNDYMHSGIFWIDVLIFPDFQIMEDLIDCCFLCGDPGEICRVKIFFIQLLFLIKFTCWFVNVCWTSLKTYWFLNVCWASFLSVVYLLIWQCLFCHTLGGKSRISPQAGMWTGLPLWETCWGEMSCST